LYIPYYNGIGNHAALGWSLRRKVPIDDPNIGNKMIIDRIGMKDSYYSFDHPENLTISESNNMSMVDAGLHELFYTGYLGFKKLLKRDIN